MTRQHTALAELAALVRSPWLPAEEHRRVWGLVQEALGAAAFEAMEERR